MDQALVLNGLSVAMGAFKVSLIVFPSVGTTINPANASFICPLVSDLEERALERTSSGARDRWS